MNYFVVHTEIVCGVHQYPRMKSPPPEKPEVERDCTYEPRRGTLRRAITDMLSYEFPATVEQICSITGRNVSAVRRSLEALRDLGLVECRLSAWVLV